MIFALNCTYKLLGYDVRKDILSPDIQKLLDKVLRGPGVGKHKMASLRLRKASPDLNRDSLP